MNRLRLFTLGIIIALQGSLVYWIFKNPYPCTVSGIGCHSLLQMLKDTWSDWYFLISVFIGVFICAKQMTNYVEKK